MHNSEQNLTDLNLIQFNSIQFISENQTSGQMVNKDILWKLSQLFLMKKNTKYDYGLGP